MFRRFHDLNGRHVTGLDTDIGRQRHLRQTDSSRVGVVRGTGDLEGGNDRVAHVLGDLAEANVDIEQGRRVAWEPARLESDGAATDGPVGAILRSGHATACAGGQLLVGA